MTDSAPVIYILHGEDEFAISRFLTELESRLGDPGTAAMNSTQLDGRSLNFDELLSITTTIPFLAKRRLVVLIHPLVSLTNESSQQKFLGLLEKIPSTTALVLVEDKILTSKRDLKNKKIHWLENWALKKIEEHKNQDGQKRQDSQNQQDESDGQDMKDNQKKLDKNGRVFIQAFPLPKGASMIHWIREQAKRSGGQFSYQAAELLASLSSENPRLADQEIQKLLAYVNYERSVEIKDVESLTADAGQGDIFALVDSIAIKDGRNAISLLRRLQEYQESLSIFGMIIRQFRLILLVHEMLDMGKSREEIMSELIVAKFVADKLISQARRFNISFLENIYHSLLRVDEAIKTSQMPADVALETFVADFTAKT
jgi:DNA polymerase-3 subunit delta